MYPTGKGPALVAVRSLAQIHITRQAGTHGRCLAEVCTQVSAYYDSLLAKLMVYGRDRQEAISKLQTALASTQVMLWKVPGGTQHGEQSTDCVVAHWVHGRPERLL